MNSVANFKCYQLLRFYEAVVRANNSCNTGSLFKIRHDVSPFFINLILKTNQLFIKMLFKIMVARFQKFTYF